MRISVIGPTYPYKGGISHFTTILVKELRKEHTVNFISWKRQYPAFLYPVGLKDTESKKPISEKAHFLLDFFNPFTWIAGFFSLKNFRTEKIILTWVSPVQAPIYFIIAMLTKLFTKAEVMYICHNVLPHEKHFYDVPFLKLAFSHADTFIVHSSEDRVILDKLIKNKKIILGFLPIFNMFSTNTKYDIENEKIKLGLRKKVLLFFGYIRPYKGLKYLLEAMPEIKKTFPDLSLLIVGEFWSKDKEEYIQLIDKLNIENDIVMINNYVPNEELGRYFAVSDVVVLPYISVTQSAAVQTAYAFNKPVIATAIGGLKEVIIDQKTGLLLNSNNPDELTNKVMKYYESNFPINRIEQYTKNYSWFNYIKLIIND